MITKIEARNPQGDVLILQLGDSANGYEVQNVDGLDPVKAEIVSSSVAGQAGEQYQTSHRGKRNIVISLGYDPDYSTTSVASLRSNLYKFFMPQATVDLKLYSDDKPPVVIEGRVESMDSPLFAKDPQATISVLCLLPDFYNPVSYEVEGDTVADTTEAPLTYAGNIETGVIFTLQVDRTLSEFFIYHRAPDNSIRILEFRYPLLTGDVLAISSVSRDKYAFLTRGGAEESVLYGISPTSSWTELFPGVNNLRVYAEGDPIPFTIEYTDKYGGL